MGKIGLILEFIGFFMLFWRDEIRPGRPIEKGGGTATHGFEQEMLLERAFSWIPSQCLKETVSHSFYRVALGFIMVGIAMQLIG
jgi:hypothetical protein